MATLNELKELALHAANGTAPETFTAGNVNDALRGELNEWVSSYANYKRHEADIFEIISTTVDAILPRKVESAIGMFAEVQHVPQGQKAEFRQKLSNKRAKAFVTQVGLAGIYESFRLGERKYTVSTHAMGSAARVDFENFLDGAENMAEFVDIIAEGYTDNVYKEITKMLQQAGNYMTFNNYVIANTFVATSMAKLCSVVKAYGNGAAIFATPEFVEAMGVDAIVPAIPGVAQPIVSRDDIDAIHNMGRIKIFRGNPIVEIPQSFVDDNNARYTIDPSVAYILPTGGEKIVKVVFEGDTHVKTVEDEDWTMEFRTYKKLGMAIHSYNNWAMYKNTSISQDVFYDGTYIDNADHQMKPRP